MNEATQMQPAERLEPSTIQFKTFLEQAARATRRESERKEQDVAMLAVKLARRFRGRAPTDSLGDFCANNSNQIVWDDFPADGQGVYWLNVTQPTMRANQAAMVSAGVSIDIEARSGRGAGEGVARVAQELCEYLTEKHWTERFEAGLALQLQIEGGHWLRLRFNPQGDEFVATRNQKDRD